ncbi:hypothetical protein, partial [Raoultella sp. 18098]|uniref:hypothetical protein n=1 Tax=Raoultella sp. 18098 TaxID=2681430 RepID=UPI001D0F5146
RVLMANGDRAYARGPAGQPLLLEPSTPRLYRVFRNAVPMKDPESGEILGYEAQYVGRAELLRGETTAETRTPDGVTTDVVPATIELSRAKEEIRFGDRLLPAPERGYASYTPQAPQFAVDARVVSIYGSAAVANAAQNQVVAINRGTRDGM